MCSLDPISDSSAGNGMLGNNLEGSPATLNGTTGVSCRTPSRMPACGTMFQTNSVEGSRTMQCSNTGATDRTLR